MPSLGTAAGLWRWLLRKLREALLKDPSAPEAATSRRAVAAAWLSGAFLLFSVGVWVGRALERGDIRQELLPQGHLHLPLTVTIQVSEDGAAIQEVKCQ